jgi:DNA primase
MDESGPFLPKVVCPNPAHDTLKSHFQINVTQPTVHCFAYCGISGSYAHAIATIEGLYDEMEVEQAKTDIERKRRAGRALHRAEKIIVKQAKSARIYKFTSRTEVKKLPKTPNTLKYETFIPQVGAEYLRKRNVNADSIAAWGIGWDPETKRIVIPAEDEHNRLRFLIKRAIRDSQTPKYLYTEGFPKTSLLFGACMLHPQQVESQGLVIVEGSLDAIWLRQCGFRNAVAILGTGISDKQRSIIARLNPPKIFLFFDKDVAGVTNIEIAGTKLRKYPLWIVKYPKWRNDPCELDRKEIRRQLSRAVPIQKFVQQRLSV